MSPPPPESHPAAQLAVARAAPVAVLLVDTTTGDVAYANEPARLLAGEDVGLPAPVRVWAEAAGLDLAAGEEPDPISRAAAGNEVSGAVVHQHHDGRRRPLWITGLPLPSLPTNPHAALVVLFELTPDDDTADLRHRAVVATERSFTISDPTLPDNPLVYVNPAFERITGFAAEEAIGRNCRFLQSAATDPAAVAELRAAVQDGRSTTVTLLNQRRDGTAFWNEVVISPVLDPAGTVTHFVGVQTDVTARVLGEAERERILVLEQEAREAAESARAQAERAHERLALLAEASTRLIARSTDVDGLLATLAGLVVPRIADWCAVEMVGDDGALSRRMVRVADPALTQVADALIGPHPFDPASDGPVPSVIASGSPAQVLGATVPLLAGVADEEGLAAAARLGQTSGLAVALHAYGGDRVLGVLVLATSGDDRRLTDDDLTLTAELARRATLALQTAQLHEREHAVIDALQRSLLPETIPDVEGLEIGHNYLSAASGVDVGGDWYDVVPLPDGRVGLVVGDVMGHDLRATADMGQLRSALLAYAWEGDEPGPLLDRLDRLVQGLGFGAMATLVYAIWDGDRGELLLANAGHPPPLVISPDGTTAFLEIGRSVMLGALPDAGHRHGAVTLGPGDTLLLYTDGLVERRGASLANGLDALAAAGAAAADLPPAALVDRIDAALARPRDDDVALLAVRVAPTPQAGHSAITLAAHPSSARAARRFVTDALRRLGAADLQEVATLLTSECVTNAVLHAGGGDLQLRVRRGDDGIRISVWDGGRGDVRPRTADEQATSGRGLTLVDALASAWGVDPGPTGKTVWFLLDA